MSTHRRDPLAPLLLLVLPFLAPACGLVTGGGPSAPLRRLFAPALGFPLRQLHRRGARRWGVLVQAGGEVYLIDASRPEEGPNVWTF